MKLVEGQVLAGSYRLIQQLGEGGMGSVWAAEHLTLERHVAIKFISQEIIGAKEAQVRFMREARATAKIDSPHVIRVLDFEFTEEGYPFLVLELLVGETLEQRLTRTGPLLLSLARQVLAHATHGLSAAHSVGVLHRDIKAENLFLVTDREGRLTVKLLDFGIAAYRDRRHPKITQRAVPLGTPQYMSPEQILDPSAIDERSDAYSLAVCMYYALTGQFPYDGQTLTALSYAVFHADLVPPSQLRPDLPDAVDAWFATALARDPASRFVNLPAMLSAFEDACHVPPRDTPITAALDATPEPSVPRRPTRRRLAAALVAFAAVGAVFASFHTRLPELARGRFALARTAVAADLPALTQVVELGAPVPTASATPDEVLPVTVPERSVADAMPPDGGALTTTVADAGGPELRAHATSSLRVIPIAHKPVVVKPIVERWNDWGDAGVVQADAEVAVLVGFETDGGQPMLP